MFIYNMSRNSFYCAVDQGQIQKEEMKWAALEKFFKL